MAAAGVIFYAYIGFDAVSTAAKETRNPQRDMPIGILASLVICTVLYVIVSAVLTGMVSYKELDVAAPVALALDKHAALHWLGIPVKFGAVCGLTSGLLVWGGSSAAARFAESLPSRRKPRPNAWAGAFFCTVFGRGMTAMSGSQMR